MKSVDLLIALKEKVSEDCFQDIIGITEGLFLKDGRGDLLDDLSRSFTGKPLDYHIKNGTKKVYNATKDKILKSTPIKNTIGKKKLDNALKELDRAELEYGYAKDCQKYSKDDPSKSRMYKEQAKELNNIADKRARAVNDIKKKYGFD